jgi:T5orf172 domain
MSHGYVYVLSNKSLKKNLFKIGLTTSTPENRAEQLSRSTSIPSNFEVYYFKKTTNIHIAERRIHLLLNEYRYSQNKEFFILKKSSIQNIIDKVVDDIALDYQTADSIHKSHDLIWSRYTTKITAHTLHILNFLMQHTKGNNLIDHIIGFEEDITNGFLSYINIMDYLNVSKAQAFNIMRNFEKKHKALEIELLDTNERIGIFKDLRYYKGEMSWVFSNEYRKHFHNDFWPANS